MVTHLATKKIIQPSIEISRAITDNPNTRLDYFFEPFPRDIKSIAAAHARRGEIFETRSELAAAFTSYDRAIELCPKEHFLQHKRGALLCQLGQLTDALQHYDRAILLDDGCIHCYADRAWIKENLDDISGAIADWTKVIAQSPNSPVAYIERGKLYYQQSQYKEAKADYKKAITFRADL